MNTEPTMMTEVRIASFEDIVTARRAVREAMGPLGYGLLDQARVVTAASELSRNIIIHAKLGVMRIFKTSDPNSDRRGIKCLFEDNGPGIEDVEAALRAGRGAEDAQGLGLAGARRLSDEFNISSLPGKGTKVTIVKWL